MALLNILREYAREYHVYLLTATPDEAELEDKASYLKENGIDFFTNFYRVPLHDKTVKPMFIKTFCENNHLNLKDCVLIDDDIDRWLPTCLELGVPYFTPVYITSSGEIPMDN